MRKPEFNYEIVYRSRFGWWEDVVDIAETYKEALEIVERSKSCEEIRESFELIQIRTYEDGKILKAIEL